jgi:hypothetical protein
MPRSLSQAGINSVPFWLTAEQVGEQPFYVLAASTRNGRYGKQVVFRLRLRDGVYDEEGNLHKIVTISLTDSGEGQRADVARYFLSSNDPLGPCVFTPVPTRDGLNDFYRLDDAPAEMLTVKNDPPVIEARTDAPDSEYDDVPF